MYTALIVIITALVAIYISLPFFLSKNAERKNVFKPENKSEHPVVEKLNTLNNQKENLFTAIREIEFDYGLGKLSREDFEELNSKYNQNLDLELEKEISMFRSSPNASTANNCSKCGAEYNLQDVFCSKCGEKLN